MKHLRLAIDDELHKQLKLHSVNTGKNLPEIVTDALRAYLTPNQQENNK
jgi:hypothetical protein